MLSKLQYLFLGSIYSFAELRSAFINRVIHFKETLGNQVKGRSPKKLKSLIEVPNVVRVKVHVPSFIVILISSQQLVLTPSSPVRRKLGRYGQVSFSEKAKNFNRGSLSVSNESTCFQLQYDPSLTSVAFSQTELSISEKLWEIR